MARDNGKIIYKNDRMKVTVRKTTRREHVATLFCCHDDIVFKRQGCACYI